MSDHFEVSRQAAVDALQLAILMIQRGKPESAIGQLHYLIDNLEISMALDERAIFQEALGAHYVNL